MMDQVTALAVSVIIPARNEEAFIAACLQSICSQDYPNYEVIVVDNGSTDHTAAIAASLGARVVYEATPGLPRTREAGRRAAQGEILVYLDADTTIPPGYLRALIAHFEQHPDILAASTPFRFHDGGWVTNATIAVHFAIYKALHTCNFTRFIFGGSFAVRSAALAQIGGFNTELEFYGEDTDLSKRLAKIGRIEFIDTLRSSTSARRYARQGIVNTCWIYLLNYLGMLFFNRTFPIPRFAHFPHIRNGVMTLCTVGFLLYGAAYPESKLFGRVTCDLNTQQKAVALTFDDEPNGVYTEQVLKVLDEEGVKATFFLAGQHVENDPRTARDIAQHGNVIGNHSYHNSWGFPFHSKSEVLREVDHAEAVIQRVTGQHTKLFRPPHGLRTPWMLQAAREDGYEVIMWDEMTNDYQLRLPAPRVANFIVKHVRRGSIIVLHDSAAAADAPGQQNAVETVRLIIHKLKMEGYTFVTL